MRILVDDRWEDAYLDYWCAPGEVRLQVRRWLNVEELDGLYFQFEPRSSLRRLWDYSREVGPVEVARKVASRLSERGRNRKFVALGIGEVVGGEFEGEVRAFVAPCHPECCERVALPESLTTRWDEDRPPRDELRLARIDAAVELPDELRGWQRESGRVLEPTSWMTEVTDALRAVDWSSVRRLEGAATPVRERRTGETPGRDAVRSTLFGRGHYARTVVVPNLPDGIELSSVHELDPVLSAQSPVTDTAPRLREDERPDAVFVAGYHATHAPIACDALRRGARVVSEKPLATTSGQLAELLDAWVEPSRYFAGFHRRHAPYNAWIREDLSPARGDPLSYHCIVHEVSLPPNHWYRWPSSGSRLLSNGCHWIDHFLFLNDFEDVRAADARRVGEEVVATIELANGAAFTMTLTDRGSDRLGTREHTELRVADRTAVIEDGGSYRAEDGERLIRREKFHKLAAHAAMYRSIGERLIRGEPGDSRRSVRQSAELVLRLERSLDDR